MGAELDILERMAKRARDRNFVELYNSPELDQAKKQLQKTARPE